ncbi:MAG: carboxypeptidase [Rhodospirillaceae bacterium]|jgi:carboxypeptidase Taq|nr:carboxypeptidase [Rhodospirillaceae bacterium]|tara:strand:- start:4075 stop:5613 length:1539 start_codon:yes stop_codon:yes gene_type:complete
MSLSFKKLNEEIGKFNDVLNSMSILIWDSRTKMPKNGARTRGLQIGTLTLVAREILLSSKLRKLLDDSKKETESMKEDTFEKKTLLHLSEAIDYHDKIPEKVQVRSAEIEPMAHNAWAEARQKKDFNIFKPFLEEQINIAIEQSQCIGFANHPYDALMHRFEPGETVQSLKFLFSKLKEGLSEILNACKDSKQPNKDFLYNHYPVHKQKEFATSIANKFGYDFNRGRLDSTVHPFEISFTREDVRITTRFYENFLNPSLFGTLHEAGHGIYEQNVDPKFTRTALTTDFLSYYAVGGVSFGAHESQSRLYENHIGRSKIFWENHFDDLARCFPEALKGIKFEDFFKAINVIEPSLIRVESDETTYDFHIMLRVEIESMLIDGSLKVKDLPEMWNNQVEKYLGLKVPDDSLGVLQDIHWSGGQFGTFCNYTIGNVMAAQLMGHMKKNDPKILSSLKVANYEPIFDWLKRNIHQHGRRYSRNELLKLATGRTLDPDPYLKYLQSKASEVYGVKFN